ncbi:hypothetical protein Bca52824_072841 [Brassica carinata]|uniref:Uncharacterized protein n=1 Tax=Brassica carinata TaxID=52824 RepID=A0A8X7Q969_BRACI|nr:hypothetical protein Bca52824_072841 [Brassica carinata]
MEKDWAPKAIPDDAEPHSKEKINELVYNGSLEKSICYLSDMDDEDNQMEHEYIVVSADQRERLAMSVERLCLEIEPESRKTMMETEDFGVSALQDLSRHLHSKLHGSVSQHIRTPVQ